MRHNAKIVDNLSAMKKKLKIKLVVLVYKLVVLGYLIYGCLLWGNNYGNPFRIMNDFPFRDHITPHYVHLDLLKFRDIVKIYNCLFLYDYVSDNKSRVVFDYFLYLSNIIILHQVHLLSNYTFPTQELIFERFALPSLENTIGTMSFFLFAINHRKSCSKRHLKNIIFLNIDLCGCVCVRACLCFNE